MQTTLSRLVVSVAVVATCLSPAWLDRAGEPVQDAARDILAQDHAQAEAQAEAQDEAQKAVAAMNVHYLEVVTPNVKETCETLAKAHGVTFSDPIAELGNARTATLKSGGRIGVRAPMRETEEPVVRPYMLVDDLAKAVEAATAAGAEIAIPSMHVPGQGTIAIYILGGIQHGLWQK